VRKRRFNASLQGGDFAAVFRMAAKMAAYSGHWRIKDPGPFKNSWARGIDVQSG
jgi:hypothetical protein